MKKVKDINMPPAKEVGKMTQNKESEAPKTFADEIIEERRKLIKEKETEKALGIGEEKAEGPKESEGMKFAQEAMNMQSTTIKSIDEARKLTQDALVKSEASKNDALTALYQHQLTTIQQAEARVVAASEKAKESSGGSEGSKSEFAAYHQVKSEIDTIIGATPKSEPVQGQGGMSEAAVLELERMKQSHDLVIEELRGGREQATKEFQLKMMQFEEDSRRKWAEYGDSKSFREQGIKGVTDLVGSIAAGVRMDAGGGDAGAGVEEKALGASVSSFSCQGCGAKVSVPHGSNKATCPNSECGMEYEIKER